jgi:citrate lyase subunit beta / citryl-CoA lyase
MRSCLILQQDLAKDADLIFASGADAFMLDLRAADPLAWRSAAGFLRLARDKEPRAKTYVRLGALDETDFGLAFACLKDVPFDGVFLDGAEGGASVQRLGARLAVFEAETERADGSIAIAAMAAQNAKAVFALGGYVGCSFRLKALGFDAKALALSMALEASSAPVIAARNLAILAAAAAGVPAVEIGSGDGPRAESDYLAARDAGFGGAATMRPADIPLINRSFTSTNRPNLRHSSNHDPSS